MSSPSDGKQQPGGSDGLKVGDLNSVASPIAAAANGFEDLGAIAPSVPNAGLATPTIALYLSQLASLMSTVSSATAAMADVVQTSGQNYGKTEDDNTLRFERRGEALDRLGLPSTFVGPVVQRSDGSR